MFLRPQFYKRRVYQPPRLSSNDAPTPPGFRTSKCSTSPQVTQLCALVTFRRVIASFKLEESSPSAGGKIVVDKGPAVSTMMPRWKKNLTDDGHPCHVCFPLPFISDLAIEPARLISRPLTPPLQLALGTLCLLAPDP